VTIFLGCGFAAKYREGGGNFSVPLQWMLGLRRPKLDAIWLEFLPSKMMRQPSLISGGICRQIVATESVLLCTPMKS